MPAPARAQEPLPATPETSAAGKKIPSARGPAPVKVMLIGDSLSFGTFGEKLEGFLRGRYGSGKICVFASCGSSPEHWVTGGPEFLTPCGYREATPKGSRKEDFSGGRPPQLVRTPKLSELLACYSPEIVIVQLGTNWMDRLGGGGDAASYKQIIRRFIRELRAQPNPPPRIVWVLPPDSSKFPVQVKDAVDIWINECAKEMGFQTIFSRRITGKYAPGKSGSDGVHYNDAEAARWANIVIWMLYAYGPD